LRQIRSNQAQGCLVIDVQLPGMIGLQLQSHLASAGRHIRIIFINACMDEKYRALAFELGAVDIRDKASGHKALLKEITWRLKPRDTAGPRNLASPKKNRS
jgi:FixJ family two-component response regulator